MRYLLLFLALILLNACSSEYPKVVIETSLGKIVIEVYEDQAPVTAENFLRHCKTGNFEDAVFYRVVNAGNQAENQYKIDVIQGGLFHDSLINQHPVIEHESSNVTGIKHLHGTISMARLEPGTASTEFFICIGDQPELDFGGRRNPDKEGFAAFGKVISGMDIVEKIHSLTAPDQYLYPPIEILSISVHPNLD